MSTGRSSTETTLLPFTKIIEWTPGQCVASDLAVHGLPRRALQETAIDLYAQADDGSLWYLGEDVNDYSANGLIVTTEERGRRASMAPSR